MKNEVKINIPLFIGLILLVASVTAILVSGVKMVTDYLIERNKEMYNNFQQIDNILKDTTNETIDITDEENDITNVIN